MSRSERPAAKGSALANRLPARQKFVQPKPAILPDGGRGGTDFPEQSGRGERRGESSAKATFKAEPVS